MVRTGVNGRLASLQKFLKRYTVNDIPPTKFQVLSLLYEDQGG